MKMQCLRTFKDLAAFTARTGFDKQSHIADPLFVKDARMELWDVERTRRERTFDAPDTAEFQLSRNGAALVTVGSPVQKTIKSYAVAPGVPNLLGAGRL